MKISKKLWAITTLMAISLTVNAGTGHIGADVFERSQQELKQKTEALLTISKIKDDNHIVLLAAMDIIVDKASGKPDEALVQEIQKSYEAMQKDLGSLISSEKEPAESVAKYKEALTISAEIYQGIQEGLYPAVKSFAPEEEFAKLDDVIDGNGAKLSELLTQLRETIMEDYHATIARAEEQTVLIDRVNTVAYVISLLLATITAWFITRSITRPVNQLVDDIRAISDGNTSTAVEGCERSDELGSIARRLEDMRGKVGAAFRLQKMVDDMPLNIMTVDPRNDFRISYANKATVDTLKTLGMKSSAGNETMVGQSMDIFHKDPQRIRQLVADPKNLPHRARITLNQDTLDLNVSAMHAADGSYIGAMLTWAVVTQQVKLADTFEGSVGSVSNQIASSASALQKSAIGLQAAIEELSATAVEISKRTHESLTVVREASAKGDNAQSSMDHLSVAAGKVSNVVTLISAIAEKINLLALNATIESARAGEAGKGFAVVAHEVKNLATQTASAIAEISKQVLEMQSSAGLTADAIKEMCAIMSKVTQYTTDISSSIEEQQASTAEIARNVGDERRASDARMETVSVLVMANQLEKVSGHLKEECTTFLERVRKM